MLDKLSDFDWSAHLTLVFSMSTLVVFITVIVMMLTVPIKEEDLRDHDADIDQAIKIANSHSN